MYDRHKVSRLVCLHRLEWSRVDVPSSFEQTTTHHHHHHQTYKYLTLFSHRTSYRIKSFPLGKTTYGRSAAENMTQSEVGRQFIAIARKFWRNEKLLFVLLNVELMLGTFVCNADKNPFHFRWQFNLHRDLVSGGGKKIPNDSIMCMKNYRSLCASLNEKRHEEFWKKWISAKWPSIHPIDLLLVYDFFPGIILQLVKSSVLSSNVIIGLCTKTSQNVLYDVGEEKKLV